MFRLDYALRESSQDDPKILPRPILQSFKVGIFMILCNNDEKCKTYSMTNNNRLSAIVGRNLL